MLVWLWIVFLLIATVVSAAALFAKQDEMALLGSVIGSVLWIVLAYGAMNLETFSEQSGDFVSQPEPALALLTLGALIACVLNAIAVMFDWFGEVPE